MFYAGIDWADDHHDVVVIDEATKSREALRVDHSVNGLAQLNNFLKEISPDSAKLACIVETSQGLLIAALLEAGWAVYPVNPKPLTASGEQLGLRLTRLTLPIG